MRVAGEHEVVAVGGERVEHARLGGVGEAEAQVGGAGRAAGDAVVAVAADVRVVDAGRATVRPPAFSVSRACVASSQPRSSRAARRSRHGSGAPCWRFVLFQR